MRRQSDVSVHPTDPQDVPYISLWYKTNLAAAQAHLRGVRRLSAVADLTFLKDVTRVTIAWRPRANPIGFRTSGFPVFTTRGG